MKSFFKAYKSSFILLISIIIGGILGIVFGKDILILKPLGDLFLNLMFVIMTPLVFFSVSSAIANMKSGKRLGKIIVNVFIVFTFTAIIAAIFAFFICIIIKPTKGIDYNSINNIMSKTNIDINVNKNKNILEHLVNTISVHNFLDLFSKNNMLQLIIFSIFFGISTSLVGEKGVSFAKFLASGNEIMMKMVKLVMYYAPIGLGAYFATVIGELGPQILQGYLRVFILYILLTTLYYFVFFTLYAFWGGGKKGVKRFWKNSIAPTVTSFATCSSAACIPINLETTKKIGVSEDIVETVIPLGANIHKDGSVIGGVLKIIFLFSIFGKPINNIGTMISIITVSFLVGAVMGSIPSGGTIGEMLIISVYGFPPEALPMIVLIATIIDAPATLLNSTGNIVCSMMVEKFVEGKNKITNNCEKKFNSTN